jgi:flagellar protein FlaG
MNWLAGVGQMTGVGASRSPSALAAPVVQAPDPVSAKADAAAQSRMAEASAAAQQQLDAYLRAHDQSLSFQFDKQTGMTIVHVYNTATGEVVRQIPTAEIVRIAQYFDQQHPMVDERA